MALQQHSLATGTPGSDGADRPGFRWTLRLKLMAGFLAVVALVAAQAALTSVLSARGAEQVLAAQEQGVYPAFSASHLKLDIVQVQQWLSDISATRGAPGFDDGFDEAAGYAEDFREESSRLAEMRPDLASDLEQMNVTFEQYYAEGRDMAAVYVAEGPEAGNELMAQFDAVAAQIGDQVDVLHDQLLAEADVSLGAAVAGAGDTQRILMVSSLAIFVAAMAIGFYLSRSISTRIREVAKVAKSLAVGDVSVEIETSGSDEIGEMEVSFGETISYLQEASTVAARIADGDLVAHFEPRSENDALGNALTSMISNLREVVGRATTVTRQVSDGSEVLAQSSEESARSATEVATSIGGVAESATTQAQITEELSQAVRRIADEVTATSSAVQGTSEASGEARDKAAVGQSQIDQATEAMDQITASFGQVADTVADLDAHSEKVEEIVDLIRSIADQTNLLALNAAIEAARAGEMGRGFAVVASEVKALAEESAGSTDQIAEIVTQMRNSVRQAITAVDTGKNQVDEGTGVVDSAGAAFAAIAQAVESISTEVGGVSASAERIQDATRAIESGTNQLTQVTENNSAASEEVAAASEQAAATSEEIGATAQELSTSAKELARTMGRFTLNK